MFISWAEAQEKLRGDAVVAVPTDTVYGLAANPFSKKALKKIYTVKGREFHKPLVLMCAGVEEVKKLVIGWNSAIELLVQKHWPGALTLIFKRNKDIVLDEIVMSGETVGIRIPQHPGMLELMKELRQPLAVTSANKSGAAELIQAQDVLLVFNKEIDGIVKEDSGPKGKPSTIVDVSVEPWKVLRAGPITVPGDS